MKKVSFYSEIVINTALVAVFSFLACLTKGWTWIHIAYLVTSIVISLIVLIFKDKGFSIGIFITGTVFNYILPMTNIEPFFLFALLMLQHPKWKWQIFAYYVVNVFIETILLESGIMKHLADPGEGAVHLAMHLAITIFYFVSISHFLSVRFIKKELILTEDEKTILEELKKEKMLKNCRSFSKNTLSQKLREARERNNLDSNSELLAQYSMQE